jgi:hypothetical protein
MVSSSKRGGCPFSKPGPGILREPAVAPQKLIRTNLHFNRIENNNVLKVLGLRQPGRRQPPLKCQPPRQPVDAGEHLPPACGLHTSVSRFPRISENRSKSARGRAICDRAGTRRTSPPAPIARIRQILSRRDFARSHCTPGETPSHVGATEQCVLRTAGRCSEALPVSATCGSTRSTAVAGPDSLLSVSPAI